MNKVMAALLALSPSLLAIWVYPWMAKPMLADTGEARLWAQRLADAYRDVPATFDEATATDVQAFAQSLALALVGAYGLTLTARQLAPLMFAIASRALSDPDFRAAGS